MSKFICRPCGLGIHSHDGPCSNSWTDSTCDCTLPRCEPSDNKDAAIAKSLDYCMWYPLSYMDMWKTQVVRFTEHLAVHGYEVVKKKNENTS